MTLNTSVVASFSNGSTKDEKAGIALAEDSTLSSSIGTTHIKVYPKKPSLFFITAGSYRHVAKKEEDAQTAIAFELTNTSTMPIFGARDVVITPQGNAYDSKGQVVNVSYYFDELAGVIRASKKVYSVILVSYVAPYDLLEYTFAGAGCPINPVKNPTTLSDYDGYYTAAMVVAVDADLDASASLQLKPPQCGSDVGIATAIRVNQRLLPKLVLEADDGIGVTMSSALDKLSAGGRVRLYPADAAPSVDVTTGTLRRLHFIRQLEVKEHLTFNGSSSVTLKYPPVNKAGALDSYLQFKNAMNNTVTVRLATHGDLVYLASFSDSGTYELIGSRFVESDEVVAVNSAGISIPVWGTAEVGYVTSYELLDYRPQSTYGQKRTFNDAVITAKIDLRVATLKVDPPAMGGSLRKIGNLKG